MTVDNSTARLFTLTAPPDPADPDPAPTMTRELEAQLHAFGLLGGKKPIYGAKAQAIHVTCLALAQRSGPSLLRALGLEVPEAGELVTASTVGAVLRCFGIDNDRKYLARQVGKWHADNPGRVTAATAAAETPLRRTPGSPVRTVPPLSAGAAHRSPRSAPPPTPPVVSHQPEVSATDPAEASTAPPGGPARHRLGVAEFAYYVVSLGTLLTSANTNWRFFGEVLRITSTRERAALFGITDLALVACGIGMAAHVRRHRTPGPARPVAWLLCGLSGYMAVALAGPVEGLARVLLGPVLGMVMLHLALGLELRAHVDTATTAWARVRREFGERALSRIGLGDTERDAAHRARDRACHHAASLLARRYVPARGARLRRALVAAHVADDPAQRAALVRRALMIADPARPRRRETMVNHLALIAHAGEISPAELPSPWPELISNH